MRTLVAAALVASARADETSLMQDLVKRSASTKLSADTKRQDSTSKLLDTAVNMIKNGVTPDVITFVDATTQDINEEVLVAIQNEHDIDQAYINGLCQDFLNAIQALEDQATAIGVHGENRVAAQEAHHNCRADEAYTCAKSRRCEEQLREKWRVVKHEESVMREIHGHIHDEWCIHPPFFADIDEWLSHPFNWAQTSPYPLLDLPQDVRDFRHVSVTHFHDYMEQKIVVETAWRLYNEKLEECATLEEAWEAKVPVCDVAQNTARVHACEHATANRAAREQFGQEWNRITALFNEARIAKTANEAARKNEWETLKIVTCLLDHVHSSVITSIETGGPCPTIDSDPDGVTLAIEDCHIVTRGCGEDSMTAHLCLDWCEEPPVPPLPPVEEPACTPTFIAREQSAFLAAIQASYTADLAANSDYPNDPLGEYQTVLSEAGWAGCAPPLVCVDCVGQEPVEPCLDHVGGAHQCHLHEEYLSAGQSNQDTFRCLDGTCITQAGRCNGNINCADGSDETGCDADDHVFVPAYLASQFECPADKHDDVHFTCANSQCIHKVGMCNGIDNCADGSDELSCSGGLQVTVEAKSGRTVSVESLQSGTGVFHDREYNFDDLGSFRGKTFIKYSNDDKMIDYAHVMTKIRTVEPLTVFVAMLENHKPGWLTDQGFTPATETGVSFSGVRETRHKEWDPSLLTTDHFDYSVVYHKTFPAGTISIPGNNGGDGSFLIFLDRPNAEDDVPPVNLWAPVLGSENGERVKCNDNVNMEYVADQAACQQLAISNGHPFYSFRHNGESGGHKCMSSAHCDDHLTDRTNEWHIYSAGGYHYGVVASNECEAEDVAEAQCLEAVQSLLPEGVTQGRTHLVAGSWGWVPPGCSVQSHFTHGQNGDWAAHYNRNPSGNNDGGYTPVCQHRAAAEWTVVQGAATSSHAGVNVGADAFNTMFAACPVVRYTNPIMTGSPAVYKRHNKDYSGDAHALFTYLWARADNEFHSQFDIYPSLADARANSHAWTFCNFADEPQPNHFTVGFPRDCGPTGYQPHIWFHATRTSGTQSQGFFEIYTGNNCPV